MALACFLIKFWLINEVIDMGKRNIVKASDVIGVKVKNSLDENLGEIYEIVIDKLSGKVRYLVLEFGGILGVGNKYFAIPWGKFTYDPHEGCFNTPLNKESLKDAPGFDKDNWPDFSDADFTASMTQYYV